jgi:hypothetical protein
MGTPTVTPKSFRQGRTVKWTIPSPDYPPSSWALTVDFSNANDARTITATNNGDGTFLVTISATDSAKFWPAEYAWAAKVTKGSEVYELESGRITVLPDLSKAVDGRSNAQQRLDQIQEALRLFSLKSPQVKSYMISGRSAEHWGWDALRAEEDRLKADVRRERDAERIAAGLPTRNNIRVRFQ